jgi:hypothetical protein
MPTGRSVIQQMMTVSPGGSANSASTSSARRFSAARWLT